MLIHWLRVRVKQGVWKRGQGARASGGAALRELQATIPYLFEVLRDLPGHNLPEPQQKNMATPPNGRAGSRP